MKSKNPISGCREVEIAKCLDTFDPNPSKNQGGIAVVEQCYPEVTGTQCASGAGLNRPAGQCNETDLCIVTPAKPPRRYIIRRLMPVECARLQGFPDAHGELALYDGDDAFWEGARKTHAEINGKKYKPTKNIKGWYDKLHNDGAEYKMWGNGIALPCAEYVIRMIKEEV